MEMMKEERDTSVEGCSTNIGNQQKKRGRPRKPPNGKVDKKIELDVIEEAEVQSPSGDIDLKGGEVAESSPVSVKRFRNRRKGIPRRAAV